MKESITASFGTTDMMRETNLSPAQIYYWERVGILNPTLIRFGEREFRRYSNEDVRRVKRVKRFLSMGFSLKVAVEKLKE